MHLVLHELHNIIAADFDGLVQDFLNLLHVFWNAVFFKVEDLVNARSVEQDNFWFVTDVSCEFSDLFFWVALITSQVKDDGYIVYSRLVVVNLSLGQFPHMLHVF